MPMNADCAFWMGSTHRVCQDYALVGGEGASVVLADGCSSSPNTDVGARLLAWSALRALSAGNDADFCETALRDAVACADRLGLPPVCLDATVMTVTAGTDGTFTARCYGDGVIALGRRDGRTEVYTISFAANAPLYPSYRLDGGRRRQWEALPGNGKSVRRWTLGPAGVEAEEECPGQGDCEVVTGRAADCRCVAVLSDGVQSFARSVITDTARTTLPVPEAEVLARLLAFQSGRGEFVQRRAQAFRRECAKAGWHHADDVSLAVLWLDE